MKNKSSWLNVSFLWMANEEIIIMKESKFKWNFLSQGDIKQTKKSLGAVGSLDNTKYLQPH